MKKKWMTAAGILLTAALFASVLMLGCENAELGDTPPTTDNPAEPGYTGPNLSDNTPGGAQGKGTVRANVSGVVLDKATYKPLSGIYVTLGGVTVQTDDLGVYYFDKVLPNTHKIDGGVDNEYTLTFQSAPDAEVRYRIPISELNSRTIRIDPQEPYLADTYGIALKLEKLFETLGLPDPASALPELDAAAWTNGTLPANYVGTTGDFQYTLEGDSVQNIGVGWGEVLKAYEQILTSPSYTFAVGVDITLLEKVTEADITGTLNLLFSDGTGLTNLQYPLSDLLKTGAAQAVGKDAVLVLTDGNGLVYYAEISDGTVDFDGDKVNEAAGTFIFRNVDAPFAFSGVSSLSLKDVYYTQGDVHYLFNGTTDFATPAKDDFKVWIHGQNSNALRLSDINGLDKSYNLGNLFLYEKGTGVLVTATGNALVTPTTAAEALAAKTRAVTLTFDKAIDPTGFGVTATAFSDGGSNVSTGTTSVVGSPSYFNYVWTDDKTVAVSPKQGYVWPYSNDQSKPVVLLGISGSGKDSVALTTPAIPVYTPASIHLESVATVTKADAGRAAYTTEQGGGLKLHFSKAITTTVAQNSVKIYNNAAIGGADYQNVAYKVDGSDLYVYADAEYVNNNIQYYVRSAIDPYDDYLDNTTPTEQISTLPAPKAISYVQYLGTDAAGASGVDLTTVSISPLPGKIVIVFDTPLTSGAAQLTYNNQVTEVGVVSGNTISITIPNTLYFSTSSTTAFNLRWEATANSLKRIGNQAITVQAVPNPTKEYFDKAKTNFTATSVTAAVTGANVIVSVNGFTSANTALYAKPLVTYYTSTVYTAATGYYSVLAASAAATVGKGQTLTGAVTNSVTISGGTPHTSAEGHVAYVTYVGDTGYLIKSPAATWTY